MLILNKIDYLLLKKKLDLNTSYVDIKRYQEAWSEYRYTPFKYILC